MLFLVSKVITLLDHHPVTTEQHVTDWEYRGILWRFWMHCYSVADLSEQFLWSFLKYFLHVLLDDGAAWLQQAVDMLMFQLFTVMCCVLCWSVLKN